MSPKMLEKIRTDITLQVLIFTRNYRENYGSKNDALEGYIDIYYGTYIIVFLALYNDSLQSERSSPKPV